MKYCFIIILFCFALAGISLSAQNIAEIKDLKIVQEGKNLVTTYTIVSEKKFAEYLFTTEVRNSQGKIITPLLSTKPDSSVIAYTGQNTNTWAFEKDGTVLNEKIYITLSIYPIIHVPLSAHLIKSAIYPGWGNYRLGNKNFYFTYGLAGWGLMAGSIMLNRSAGDNYENYKNTFDPSLGDEYFNRAVTQNKISYVCFGVGAALWIANITGIITKHKKVKEDIKLSEYYHNQSQQRVSANSNMIYFDNRPEWRIAMDEGDKLFRNGKYENAREYYEKALAKNNSNEIKDRITETDKKLEEQRQILLTYNQFIKRADSLYTAKDYSAALADYESAQKTIPSESYPSIKIEQCKKEIEEIKKEKEYSNLIVEADKLLKEKLYEDSKDRYDAALKLYPNRDYPKTQKAVIAEMQKKDEFNTLIVSGKDELKKSNFGNAKYYFKNALEIFPDSYEAKQLWEQAHEKLAQQEQNKKNEDYKNYLSLADEALSNKEYDKALKYYNNASALKPTESYPHKRINEVNAIINKKLEPLTEKEVFSKCKDAVFFILAVSNKYWDTETNTGTGFFINSDGTAISNYHVYDRAKSGQIYLGDYNGTGDIDKSKIYEIEKVIAQDKEMDYVIFKVKKKYSNERFPSLTITNSTIEVLDKVLAIGNPQQLIRIPSPGVIKQHIAFDGINYILTDVGVTFGNSGGPLLNMKGEVIGIMTLAADGGTLGLNYAIDIQKIPGIWKYK